MNTLVGQVGNPVTGDQFWGREKELALLLERIGEGAHVSIIAQRRIGKTSLMLEAGKRLSPENYIVLNIDVQDARSPADMVVKLTAATKPYAGVWAKTKSAFSNILNAVKENIDSISVNELEIQLRAGLSGDAWKHKGAEVLATLAAQEMPVVLFIDELPILIDRMLEVDGGKATAHELLTWLRARAQEHRGRLCMVFAGSIGLEPVLHKAGLSANLNHLTPFVLEPWTDTEALGCLYALAAHRNIQLPDATVQRMLELLGCNIPHHVQLFFACIWEHCRYTDAKICLPETAELVFQHRMLSTQGHAYLVHMEERLRKVLAKDELFLATDILTQTAVQGFIDQPRMYALCDKHAVPKMERMRALYHLFQILEHDGYLRQNSAGEYVYVSNLLREWWRARFDAFFETV